jgi:DNA-binding NarL/FixJ family response regulator
MCLLIRTLLKEHVSQVEEYMNYDRSHFLTYAMNFKPDFVFMERRASDDETGSIIHRFRHISPNSKFFILTEDEHYSEQFIKNVTDEYEAVVSDKELSVFISQFIENFIKYYKPSYHELLTKASILYTKTEKEICEHLVKGFKSRKISQMIKKPYNTVRKHVSNIYVKAGIKLRKETE